MRKVTKFFQTKPTSVDEDNKTVTFAISTDQVDREGEIIDQKSWNFKDYLTNPQFLWGHDPSIPENVLGRCLEIKSSADGSETLGTFQFDTDINPKADLVFKQVVRGSLRTVSVGFITGEEERTSKGWLLKGNTLVETSVVPIPSNTGAIAKDYKAGLISRKDATWLMESARKEADFVEKEMEKTNDKEERSMDEVSQKQLGSILEAVTTLAEGQSAITKKFEELSTKGAVSDILNSDQSWEVDDAKWDNISMVSAAYSALCEAYFYSAAPVDQFSTLLKEFVQIVSKIADGSFEKSAEGLLGDKIQSADDVRVKAATGLLMGGLNQKGSTSLPLAPEDTAWDGGAARKAVKAWATDSDGNVDYAKYGKAFFAKTGDGDKAADYKLPFATIIDDKLTAVWNGVKAAYDAVEGARGGVDGIDEDAVLKQIKSYYKKFDKEFPQKALDLDDVHTKDGEVTDTKDADTTTDKDKTTDADKDKEDASTTEDAAKDGNNDQSGAPTDGEIDLDADLTDELQEKLEKQLA